MEQPIELGTGTEDYFNSGWYFWGEHSNPLSGLARLVESTDAATEKPLWEYSMYRHHVFDAPFGRSGIRMGMEVGHEGRYAHMTVRSFALAYAWDAPRVALRKHFDVEPVETVTSALDAEWVEEPVRFGVRRGMVRTKLPMPCSKGSRLRGALVVRTYDADGAPQRGVVSVGGKPRDAFFEARSNSERRLAQDERWIDLDGADCKGGIVDLDVRGANAEWSESAYDVSLYER
jgi:hypothetical protein